MIVAVADKAKAAAAIRAASLRFMVRNLFEYCLVHDDPPNDQPGGSSSPWLAQCQIGHGSSVRINDPLEVPVAFETSEGLLLIFTCVIGGGRASGQKCLLAAMYAWRFIARAKTSRNPRFF